MQLQEPLLVLTQVEEGCGNNQLYLVFHVVDQFGEKALNLEN